MIDENGIDEEEQRLAFEEPIDPQLEEWLKPPIKIVDKKKADPPSIKPVSDLKLERTKSKVKKDKTLLAKEDEKIKKEKNFWATKIIKKFSDIIPILPTQVKGSRRLKAGFSYYESLHDLATIIKETDSRFKFVSQVLCSALYIGIFILARKYEYNVPEKMRERFYYFYEALKEAEEDNQSLCVIDDFTTQIEKYKKGFQCDIFSQKELNEKCEFLVSKLPKSLQETGKRKVLLVISNDNISPFYENHRPTQGRGD